MALLSMFFVGYIMLHCGASTDPETRGPTTVHRNRNLDHYAIGRPLERYAGFWLNYMKGLKGDHGDTAPLRSEEAPRRRKRSPLPTTTPTSPTSTAKDPFSDPFFKAPDPLDDVNLPMSPAFDDVRGIIDRARRRHRDLKADADRRARF